jgi:MtN3 and saliva related transmembrane protein
VTERDDYHEGGSMVSTALGITAATWAVVMALSPILQIREILRRRSSEGVSIGYFAVLLVGFGLWISYGIATHDVPLVVPNCVALLVMGCTIIVALEKR